MKNWAFIFFALLLSSCEKQEIEPVGFFEANYYTDPSSDQTFSYYFDDGEFVAGGLDEYIAAVNSSAGTFNQEQLLLLKMRTVFDDLPDSIVPWTYFMGLNYSDTLLKTITVEFNTAYPYNNFAHSTFNNELFYSQNIQDMKLIKVKYTDPAGLYYDPSYEFTIDGLSFNAGEDKVSFETQTTDEIYALCYVAKPFQDSLFFSLNSGGGENDQVSVHEGFRKVNLLEGAVFESNLFQLDYTPASNSYLNNSDDTGWQLKEIHLKTINIQEGIISNDAIQLEMLIEQKLSEVNSDITRLKLTSNTTVDLVSWPDVGEYGTIVFDGFMEKEATQNIVNVDLAIKFKRLR